MFDYMHRRRSTSQALLVLALGIASAGCHSKPADKPVTTAVPNAANELAMNRLSAPIGERLVDTTPTALPVVAPAPAPVTTSRAPKIAKPGSDENLPNWVPLRGRLTVVEAPDLAENLGLVPKGTTKTAQGRISVADALATPVAATPDGAAPVAAPVEAGPRSATWLASNGRVRQARGHGRR